MKTKIVVIGSSNTDMVMRVEEFPRPGETIMGHGFMQNLGGKGANPNWAKMHWGTTH